MCTLLTKALTLLPRKEGSHSGFGVFFPWSFRGFRVNVE